MTNTTSSIRSLIGAVAVLAATSTMAVAAGNDSHFGAASKALPGATAQVQPCGPGRINGPLGY